MKTRSLFPLLALLSTVACAEQTAPSTGDASGGGGKADGLSDVSLEANGLKMTLSREIQRIDAGGEVRFIVRGKTNKWLTGGQAYQASTANPHKTPIGQWTQLSVRRFELSLSVAEMRDVAAGATVFADLVLQNPGDEYHYILEFSAGARIVDHVGAANPLVSLQPFVADGRVVHRIEAQTVDTWYGPTLVLGRIEMPGHEITPRRWSFDIPDSMLTDVLRGDGGFELSSGGGTGRLVAMVNSADLTWSTSTTGEDDLYGFCWVGTKNCLDDLGAAASDTSECGTAIEVLACADELGVRVDQADIDAALAAVKFEREDAVKLVGDERADELTGKVVAAQTAVLAARIDAWYLDDAAKEQSLEREAKALPYQVAAYPLEWVAPLTLTADNLADAAPVAADALMLYMAGYDLLHSEYQATLPYLIAYDYDEYLDEAAYLRTGEFEPNGDWESGPWEGGFIFVGRWLGSYTEVQIHPDSEPDVYFEID